MDERTLRDQEAFTSEGSVEARTAAQWTYPDRRRLARFPLEVLLQFRRLGDNATEFSTTRNLSAGGIYFVTQAPMSVGQEIDCILMLPQRLTLAPSPVLIGCQAKVLRLNRDLPNHMTGVAVEVYSYDFSHSQVYEYGGTQDLAGPK